jgi:hypothetical protein
MLIERQYLLLQIRSPLASLSAGTPLSQDTSLEQMEQQMIEEETRRLRRHLGLGETVHEPDPGPPDCQPLFFIEIAPHSSRGAKCKLPSCPSNISPRDYRVALNPGMRSPTWVRLSNQNSGASPFLGFERS